MHSRKWIAIAVLNKCAILTNVDEEDNDADIDLFGQSGLFHYVPDIVLRSYISG